MPKKPHKYPFVNQKIIDGKTYTAWRYVDKGVVIDVVTHGDKEKKVKLKKLWTDDEKVKDLFYGR